MRGRRFRKEKFNRHSDETKPKPKTAKIRKFENEKKERKTRGESNKRTNNALVTLVFPEPCIKETTATYVELHPTDTGSVIKTGTATWARIFNGAGEVAADLTVSTDISLANTNLALGGTLFIQSIKLRP